jgi:RNA polymerase sigma-70 factor (ECF subfamily)
VPNTYPDWAALYSQHRDAMWRVAQKVLRDRGLAHNADDAVHEAMKSLIASPPAAPVRNWEALMVNTARNRALDILKSAAVRKSIPGWDPADYDAPAPGDLADDVAEALDSQQAGAIVPDLLAKLDDRVRRVAWEYIGLARPCKEVAVELGVTPSRVSQLARQALEELRVMIRKQVADVEV